MLSEPTFDEYTGKGHGRPTNDTMNTRLDIFSTAHPAFNPATLAPIATTGSYTDLTNKPTIPAAQVSSDWSAGSGVAQILNKPTLGSLALLNSLTYSDVGAASTSDSRLTDARAASDVFPWAKAATKPAYTYSEVGAASTTDSRLSDSRIASDVYSWAKATTKPAYIYSEVGADASGAASTVQVNLNTHTGNTSNPHSVTKTQVGLSNADNTSDANKPISTAVQAAFDNGTTARRKALSALQPDGSGAGLKGITPTQVGAVAEAPNDANSYIRSALGWVIGYTKSAIDTIISGLSSIYVSLATYNAHTSSNTAHGLRPNTFSNISSLAKAALPAVTANAFIFTVYSSPTCTSTLAIDPANGEEQKIVLGGACTGTISLASAGTARKLFLRVKQPVAGHQTMSLKYTGGTNVKWPSGSVPTFTNTSSAVDYIACRVYSGWASCTPSQDMK
jgi:hypothetical protein